jgi:hypothetical protein
VPFCHLGHRHPGLDLSNTARHRCSVTVNSTNTQRSVTHVLIPMCHVGPETGQFPILRVSREKFLYHFKAGPAGGRLRRPSSAGNPTATGAGRLNASALRHSARRATEYPVDADAGLLMESAT